MNKFTEHTGTIAPINRSNIDTDAIIPKQYLKLNQRSGFGEVLFDQWRYLDPGEPGQNHQQRRKNPDFILNQPPYDQSSILLGRENFGCGSSREHAVWAIIDYGFRVVIAPSMADIFLNNSFKNGLLPIVLDDKNINFLFDLVEKNPAYEITIDLVNQGIYAKDFEISFAIDPFRKHCLLHGLDDIELTLTHAQAIIDYEERYKKEAPWLFQSR